MGGVVNDGDRRDRWNAVKERVFNTDVKATALANTALKSAILLNGGAALALLAFLANQWDKKTGIAANLLPVTEAMYSLVIGVFAAVIATGVGYLSTYFESLHLIAVVDGKKSSERWVRLGNALIWVGMLLVIYSYCRFGVAMHLVSDVFSP